MWCPFSFLGPHFNLLRGGRGKREPSLIFRLLSVLVTFGFSHFRFRFGHFRFRFTRPHSYQSINLWRSVLLCGTEPHNGLCVGNTAIDIGVPRQDHTNNTAVALPHPPSLSRLSWILLHLYSNQGPRAESSLHV